MFSCDSSNCFNTNIIIAEKTGQVLSFSHAYHNICFSQNSFKCLHCLDYIKSSVDKYVQSLLNHLRRLNSNNEADIEESDPISEEEDDDKESVDDISASWDIMIRRFLQQ